MPGTGYFDELIAPTKVPEVPLPPEATWSEDYVGRFVKQAELNGKSADETLKYLEKQNLSPGIKATITTARKAKKEPSEIVHFLRYGKDYDVKRGEGATSAFARGGNTVIANTLGLIPDLAQGLFNMGAHDFGKITGLYDYKPESGPVGGSEFNRGALNKLFETAGANRKPTYESLEDLPPNLRPAGAAGESLFGSELLSFIPGAAALKAPIPGTVVKTAPRLRNALDPIMESAAKRPGAFIAGETAANVGAGSGVGTAEALAPGDKNAQVAGGVVGTVLNPVSRLAKWGTRLAEGSSSVLGRMGKSGREDAAIDLLLGQAEKRGEDLTEVAAALKRASDLGMKSGTTAQVTGSKLTQDLEEALGQKDANFGRTLTALREQHIGVLENAYERLAGSGNPDDLIAAAKVRDKIVRDKLASRLEGAAAKAQEAKAKAFEEGLSRDQIPDISRRVNEPVEQALKDARTYEKKIWEGPNGGRDRISQYTNLNNAGEKVKAELPRDEGLPPEIGRFLEALNAEGATPPTVGELLSKRSTLLDAARVARAAGNGKLAGIHNEIADAILKDIDAANLPQHAEARAYSKALNDVFTRTFVDDALARTSEGGRAVSPEMVLNRAFGSGKEAAAEKFGALERAGTFADELNGPPKEYGLTGQIRSGQDNFLRVMANSTVGADGRVNPKALETFLRNNAALLERFPELKQDLADAASAENLLKYQELHGKAAQKFLEQKAIFNKLLGVEDASKPVGQVLSGKNPVQEYKQLVQLARRTGPNAVAGLRTATLDAAIARATPTQGPASFTTLNKVLRKPTSRGQPSILDMMRKEGVLSGDEAKRLDDLLNWGQLAELKGLSAAEIDELPGAIPEFIRGTLGIHLGHWVGSKGLGASTLQMSSLGKTLVNRFAVKLPWIGTKNVLKEYVSSPEFAHYLLTKPRMVSPKIGPIETVDRAWEAASEAWLKSKGLPTKVYKSAIAAIKSLPPSEWQQSNAWLLNMGINWPRPPDEPMPGYLSGDVLRTTMDIGEGDQTYSVPLNVDGERLSPAAAIQRFVTENRLEPQTGGDGFDTVLTPDQEVEFAKWKARYAPKDSGDDYDLRGAFLAGAKPNKEGHWPDTFKKPNHPTFSNESKYAKFAPDKAGHWEGGKFIKPEGKPPVKGARKAPDGNWYVSDPKRPGKYLRVSVNNGK